MEETLNALQPKRTGHAMRSATSAAQTKAGEVRLKVPNVRAQSFETAIIERYRRRESSVEEGLIQMNLAGVSVRQVEDMNYATIEAWRNRPIPADRRQQAFGACATLN